MRLRFLGANGNVTGSQHFVEHKNFRFLVDCGMVQERSFLERNWLPCLENAKTLNAVFLTHAHLDHCGLLPKLVKDGFHGKIYATSATVELAKLILYDSAHIQEEDVQFKRKRHQKEKRQGPRPVQALYTKNDVDKTVELFHAIPYDCPTSVTPEVQVTFYEAGHVLGSSFIQFELSDSEATGDADVAGTPTSAKSVKRLLFSGDLGRANRPILRDPVTYHGQEPLDVLVVESTYGDRVSPPIENVDQELTDVINRTTKRGGKVIMPVFAVERAQEVLYRLKTLQESGQIPSNVPIFLDSPMAVEATMIFTRHPECFDEETLTRFHAGERFEKLSLLRTAKESMQLNLLEGPAIIMASAGMCNAGRIKHHLANHIENKLNTILFLGYQAYGTLGRLIVDGATSVRIFGQPHAVNAEIAMAHGISGHADQSELLAWIKAIPVPPREIFVVHGESESSETFAELVRNELPATHVFVPRYKDEFDLA